MFHKIVHIKNVGKFSNYNSGSDKWNGIFKKVSTIYAENGSGKTTFTQILKSISEEDDEYIQKRKSLGSSAPISIQIIDDHKKTIKYASNHWNIHINNIEVFDFLFVESNVYLITLGNYENPGTLFEVVIGDEAIKLFNNIKNLRTERKKLTQRRRNLRLKIKTADEADKYKLECLVQKALNQSSLINAEITRLEKQLSIVAEDFGKIYLQKINEYLRYFSTNLELTKLNKKGSKFVYFLRISNYDVRSESDSVSLRHTLSEGEKNALALSFFLARLALKPNIEDYLVVFDDPLSSLDYNRRNVTINLLSNFARKANQFILLSHDLNFIKDFTLRVPDALNLKIVFNGETSIFIEQDVKKETLTGIFKDLLVLDTFIKYGETGEYDKRDVVRCIRPCIEGLFRIKYFTYIDDTKWLGDIIEFIKHADEHSIFYRQKDNLETLCDINDYSKIYHHSNPNYLEVPINTEELKTYCRRTLELLTKI
ncbi:AAA family ATPase [Bacteroides acidifaciens]|uniref:AAA family ATPase n=2 Tax=Bacteroides acidifaciens TaxID=85831 RepID=UPI002613DDD0|nr:AAA family ATPase [Bacteroides acidifaciens]